MLQMLAAMGEKEVKNFAFHTYNIRQRLLCASVISSIKTEWQQRKFFQSKLRSYSILHNVQWKPNCTRKLLPFYEFPSPILGVYYPYIAEITVAILIVKLKASSLSLASVLQHVVFP